MKCPSVILLESCWSISFRDIPRKTTQWMLSVLYTVIHTPVQTVDMSLHICHFPVLWFPSMTISPIWSSMRGNTLTLSCNNISLTSPWNVSNLRWTGSCVMNTGGWWVQIWVNLIGKSFLVSWLSLFKGLSWWRHPLFGCCSHHLQLSIADLDCSCSLGNTMRIEHIEMLRVSYLHIEDRILTFTTTLRVSLNSWRMWILKVWVPLKMWLLCVLIWSQPPKTCWVSHSNRFVFYVLSACNVYTVVSLQLEFDHNI